MDPELLLGSGITVLDPAKMKEQKNTNFISNFSRVAGARTGAGRSRGFWLEPELEPKFSPGSGSYSYSTVL